MPTSGSSSGSISGSSDSVSASASEVVWTVVSPPFEADALLPLLPTLRSIGLRHPSGYKCAGLLMTIEEILTQGQQDQQQDQHHVHVAVRREALRGAEHSQDWTAIHRVSADAIGSAIILTERKNHVSISLTATDAASLR